MNNVSILLGSLALAGLASGVYLLKASGASKSDADDFPDTKSSDKPVLQPVGDKLPILTGHYLLQQGNRPALIQSIHEKLGFSDTAFQNDVLPVLEQFAFYIQQTPASEAHHHAHPGGLIDHCLEVASISLRLSSAMNLPPNVATEDKKRLATSGDVVTHSRGARAAGLGGVGGKTKKATSYGLGWPGGLGG